MAKFAAGEMLGVTLTLLCYWVSLVSAGDRFSEDQIKVSDFDVKPGGQVHVQEESWDGITCKFTYASQGGTKEKWSFGISRSADSSHYSCSVERPGGTSYLFFLHFKLEVSEGFVFDGEAFGNKDKLKPEEYKVDKVKNFIASQEGSFKAELSQVKIFVNVGKGEL